MGKQPTISNEYQTMGIYPPVNSHSYGNHGLVGSIYLWKIVIVQSYAYLPDCNFKCVRTWTAKNLCERTWVKNPIWMGWRSKTKNPPMEAYDLPKWRFPIVEDSGGYSISSKKQKKHFSIVKPIVLRIPHLKKPPNTKYTSFPAAVREVAGARAPMLQWSNDHLLKTHLH